MLNESQRKYSVYGKEFYTIICSLDHWCRYLHPKPFMLFSYHKALKFLNSQQKLSQRYAY